MQEEWVPKTEVALQLNVSERTLYREIARLKIQEKQIKMPGRRPVVCLHRDDIERLKHDRVAPQPASVPETALTVRSQDHLVRTMHEQRLLPLFLPLKAASLYSGLSLTLLRRLIREHRIGALKDGGWKVSRPALEDFARCLQPARHGEMVPPALS